MFLNVYNYTHRQTRLQMAHSANGMQIFPMRSLLSKCRKCNSIYDHNKKGPTFHAPTATKLIKAKRLKLPVTPPSVEMMNDWSYTSTTPYALTVCTKTILSLSYELAPVYETRCNISTGHLVVLQN
jgi:hypothetical protein